MCVFKNTTIFSNSVKAEKPLFFILTKGSFPSAFYTLTSFLQRFISVKLNYFQVLSLSQLENWSQVLDLVFTGTEEGKEMG